MGRLATSERRNRALCTLNPLSPPFRTHPPPFLRLFAAAYTAVPRGNLMPSPRGLFIPSGICWHVRDATAATLSAAGGYWYQLGPESLSPEGIGYYFSMRRAPPSPHHSSWPSSPRSGFASLLHPPPSVYRRGWVAQLLLPDDWPRQRRNRAGGALLLLRDANRFSKTKLGDCRDRTCGLPITDLPRIPRAARARHTLPRYFTLFYTFSTPRKGF